MDRKEYTPTRTSKPSYANQTTAANAYVPPPLPQFTTRTNGSDLAIMREYELLKSSVKQLEVVNRQLSTEVEQLRYEKSFSQNKYIQKMSYEEEANAQMQKEKNYQLELAKIKHEEELNKVRRENELRLDDLHREIKNRDYLNREAQEKLSYLDLKNNELKKELNSLEAELMKHRDNNSLLAEGLTKEEFANKKLEMLVDELERQKSEMEQEIHVLLDIEAEKSRAINSLEIQLRNSENTERCLQQKLGLLTDNFASLEEHIAVMKERLLNSDVKQEELERHLENAELSLRDKEIVMSEQKEREVRLREELEQHQLREVRKEKEVTELMTENQRLYRELNATRHQLHSFCVEKGIDL